MSRFTDDTVMTVAVVNALLDMGNANDTGLFRQHLVKKMQQWGRQYPKAGYGGKFLHWLVEDDPQPYSSWGNGSAMRVFPVGWYFETLEETLEYALVSAAVSHNHPEGVKGAQATAAAIFLARNGKDNPFIREYIETTFGYDLSRKLSDIRPSYDYDSSCKGSVPESIICFLEAADYEDTVRNAVSLGGDTDTMAAIAGSIAEAYWGMPEDIIAKAKGYLDPSLLEVMDTFTGAVL